MKIPMRADMQRRFSQRGFSLIELMVAMTITLIISGAIYGLLSTGQSAFRREPALVDRQQNIRIAMDLITRDVENAGAGMTAVPANLAQVFTDNLNNPGANSVASEIFPGQRADFLEMMANDGTCPTLGVCGAPAGNILYTFEPPPQCMTARAGFLFVAGEAGPAGSITAPVADRRPGLLWGAIPATGLVCGLVGSSGGLFTLPVAPAYNPGVTQACGTPPGGLTPDPAGNPNTTTRYCRSLTRMQLVRYEIAPETPGTPVNPITNPPSLWRSDYGLRNYDLTLNTGPTNTPVGPNNPWQVVARGIDDLQIQYFTACPSPGGPVGWCNVPGTVVNGPPPATSLNTVVQRVQITLSARTVPATGQALASGGETIYAPGGTPGRRGQLTTTVAPRAALMTLAAGSPTVQWR